MENLIEPKATIKDSFLNPCTDIRGSKIPMSLYHYFIDNTIIAKNGILVPPTSAIVSVVYTPYLERSHLTLANVNYDYPRFPVEGLADAPGGTDMEFLAKNTELQKIQSQTYQFIDRKLGEFTPYKITGKNIGGARNWRNEGKLWQYPYHHAVLYDGISEPLEIKPHLCQNSNKADINVKCPITATGQYNIYVPYYNNDWQGVFEGMTSTSSLQLPLVSSAYTDYMAMNKNQMSSQRNQNIGKLVLGGAAVATGLALAAPSGGTSVALTMAGAQQMMATAATAAKVGKGIKTAGTLMAISGATGTAQTIASNLATERDLKNTPGTLQGTGADLMFDLQNNLAINRNSLNLYRISTKEEYLQRLGDYFAMFGYSQNKVMRPNVRNRYYYNYIKTSGVNITCKDNVGIPKEHFNLIKAIYDRGTTIWHISRPNVNVGDYSKDNYEN